MADVALDLPVVDLGLAALAFSTARRDVTLGLPRIRIRLEAPAVQPGGIAPLDTAVATLYARDGVTRRKRLPNARGIVWRDVLNRPGSATFEVPLDDDSTADIDDLSVVELAWIRGGRVRQTFKCRIRGEAIQLAVDGTRWLRFENMPGAMDFAGDAVLYPQQDLETTDLTTRWFGFMSPDGAWKVDDEWVTPHGQTWADTSDNFRNREPHDFRGFDRDAQWISAVGINTTQPEFNFNYFRGHLTLDDPSDVEILYTADNYPHIYLDGELIASWDPPGRGQWRTAYTVSVSLDAGTHLFAAQVQNSRFSFVQGVNPIALIMSMRALNPDGSVNRDLGILMHTDTVDWIAHGDDPEPGWFPAQVLRTLIDEAKDRDILGPSNLLYGFNNFHDSDGRPWEKRGQYELDVATVDGVAIIATLTETPEFDVDVRPGDMRLMAYRRQGEDRSADVELRLGDHPSGDGTLIEHEATTRGTQFNSILTQLPIKRWMKTEDDASVADVGRIEAGVNTAPLGTLGSGGAFARQQLDEGARQLVQFTAKTTTLDGPIAGVDYDKGDSISTPSRRHAGLTKARVFAINYDFTVETPKTWPELVSDTSA